MKDESPGLRIGPAKRPFLDKTRLPSWGAENGRRVVTKSKRRSFDSPSLRSGSLRMTASVGHPGIWLVTSPKVAGAAEKQRLAAAYGAGLVDMEAAGVARLAQMRGIPFYCIKGISDGYTDQLPDFNRFISANGKFSLIRFIPFALLRPWYWLALARMGENSRVAAQAIKEAILDFLDERAYIRRRNGYPDLTR